VQSYFEQYRFFALGWWIGDGTPEQQALSEAVFSRFNAALSKLVTEVCQAQAEAQGY
jgi:hypothetical protein